MSSINRKHFQPRRKSRPTPSYGTSKNFLSNAGTALPAMVCDRRFMQSTPKSVNAHQSVGNLGNIPATAGDGTRETVFGHIPEWMRSGIVPNQTQGVQTCREPTANEIRQWPDGTLIFACDPCAKEYIRKADWKFHVATHLRCNYPDCNFEAKSKILERHVSAVHLSKASKAVTDADNAWISQRRQNFPVIRVEPSSIESAIDKNSGPNDKVSNHATDGHVDLLAKVRFPNWVEAEDLSEADAKIKRLLEEAESSTSRPFKRKRLDRTNLLEKLLQPEIVQERTILLQCIHYLIQNQFFLRPDQLTDTEKRLLAAVNEKQKEKQRQVETTKNVRNWNDETFGTFGSFRNSGAAAATASDKLKGAEIVDAPVRGSTSKTKQKIPASAQFVDDDDASVFAGLPENERWLRPAK